MPRLGAVAHYSAKGDRNAHVSMEDPLENRGYALWLSCQGKIRTSKAQKANGPADRGVGDVAGYEIEVNLKRKCFDLWPGLNQMDRPSQDSFISEIYAYLRQSGNAICVRKPGLGEHGIPLWWLREHWNDVKAVGIFRTTELTAREKRLTPKEAGEDREPSPVEVRRAADAAAAAVTATPTPTPSQGAAVTATRVEQIIAVLKASPQPLYQTEIADGIGLDTQKTGRLLRDLEEKGKIFRRLESKGERPDDASGRFRYLYSHTKKVPLRKTPLDLGNQTMERVWAMKPGEELRTSWMSPGNQKRVAEMVAEGLLEYVNQGTPDEKIRLAPAHSALERPGDDPAPAPAEALAEVPESTLAAIAEGEAEIADESKPMVTLDQALAEGEAVTLEDVRAGQVPVPIAVAGIARQIEQVIQQAVAQVTVDTTQLEARDRRIRELEAKLIEARSELSGVSRERDELRDTVNGIRERLKGLGL